jgi:hypothetical protein
MNNPSMLLPMNLSQYIFFLIFTKIALPIFEMFLAEMPDCGVIPRPLLRTLVLWERLVTKALETPFWFLSL